MTFSKVEEFCNGSPSPAYGPWPVKSGLKLTSSSGSNVLKICQSPSQSPFDASVEDGSGSIALQVKPPRLCARLDANVCNGCGAESIGIGVVGARDLVLSALRGSKLP